MTDNLRLNELCYSTLSSNNPNTYDTYIKLGYTRTTNHIKKFTNG